MWLHVAEASRAQPPPVQQVQPLAGVITLIEVPMPTVYQQPDQTQRTPALDASSAMLEEDELDLDALATVVGGLARPMVSQLANTPFRNAFEW